MSEFQSSNRDSAFALIPAIFASDFLLAARCPVSVSIVLIYLTLMTLSVTCALDLIFKMSFLLSNCIFLQGDLMYLGLYFFTI